MSTIGNTATPTAEDGTGAYALAISFTMSENGTLTKLSMYCRNSTAANNVVISLFGDNGSNQPDLSNKIADTGSLTETVGGAANGTLTEGSASGSLTNGTKYWLCGSNTSAAGDHDNHKMGLTTGGSFLYRSGNGIPTGTWATGDFGTHSGDTPTMYATYTPSGGSFVPPDDSWMPPLPGADPVVSVWQ